MLRTKSLHNSRLRLVLVLLVGVAVVAAIAIVGYGAYLSYTQNIEKQKPLMASPIVQVQQYSGGDYLLLDKNARVVNSLKSPDRRYPVMSYYQSFRQSKYEKGAQIPYDDIQLMTRALSVLNLHGIQPKKLAIWDKNMIRLETGDSVYIFASDKDIDQQMSEFNSFLTYRKRNNQTAAKEVDFRFANIVTR